MATEYASLDPTLGLHHFAVAEYPAAAFNEYRGSNDLNVSRLARSSSSEIGCACGPGWVRTSASAHAASDFTPDAGAGQGLCCGTSG